MPTPAHIERNRSSAERLRRLVDRLDGEHADRPVEGAWTIAALLAHIAFWDRFVLARWEDATRAGLDAPPGLDDGLQDLLNAAALRDWLALPAHEAGRLAVTAAEEIDRAIAALDARRVETVLANGPIRLLDRSFHRDEHLDTIEPLVADRRSGP